MKTVTSTSQTKHMYKTIEGPVTLWEEATDFWFEHIKPHVIERYRSADQAALRTSWNDYVDSLHKTQQISDWQRDNWSSPVRPEQELF